jgi:hypothetical protein
MVYKIGGHTCRFAITNIMIRIRCASREEVVSYYITSELHSRLERVDRQPGISPQVLKTLSALSKPDEGALQHFSRVLLLSHSWLCDQFWKPDRLTLHWSLVTLHPNEIDVLPIGNSKEDWDYPKLDILVQRLRVAARDGTRIPGVKDDPQVDPNVDPNILLKPHFGPMLLKRIIVIKGVHDLRSFDYIIADGRHRAIILADKGDVPLEAYYGSIQPHEELPVTASESH